MSYQAMKQHEDLKCIFLRERSQSEKTTYCMIPIIGYSGKGKAMETIKIISGCQDGGREEVNRQSREDF